MATFFSSSIIVELFAAVLWIIQAISSSASLSDNLEAFIFLERYGYLEEATEYSSGLIADKLAYPRPLADSLVDAILNFQHFVGINETGELDNATLVMMKSPRCGVEDQIVGWPGLRRKRSVKQGKWEKSEISYKISKHSKILKDQLRTEMEIARAFKVWSDVIPLYFYEKKWGRVDINIRFEERDHGDDKPFDGPGKDMAHAYYPNEGGNIHFDDEENWTLDEKLPGTYFFPIAVHEIGHSLGLTHSNDDNALMFCYNNEKAKRASILHPEDIKRIQKLYGSTNAKTEVKVSIRPTESITPPTRPTESSAVQSLCHDASIDTVTTTQDRNTYVFKGDFYWKILGNGIANGYPRKISQDWNGLEGNLDASLTGLKGKTYFFKSGKYWRFTNQDMDTGYPKLLRAGFKGMPNSPDAAFVWNGNGKTYFFKGDKYWRYEAGDPPPVSDQYPKLISRWKGLPNNIDAAFRWKNNSTYFFKGDKYYKLDDEKIQVQFADPPYPRSTSVFWLKCKPSTK